MWSNILCIQDLYSPYADGLKFMHTTIRELPFTNQATDKQIHQWLVAHLKDMPELEAIVIPVRLGFDDADYTGLRVGMHIRLTPELEHLRFLPLFFISEEHRDQIVHRQLKQQREQSGLLLHTPGTMLASPFDLPEMLDDVPNPVSEQLFSQKILPLLNVENPTDMGHQLANEWGAFRLARFAGINLDMDMPTDLYFKYKYAHTNTRIKPLENKARGLTNRDCRFLLIDDNADKGWASCLEQILKKWVVAPNKKLTFDVIDNVNDAEKQKHYDAWDLIFLDLRLIPSEDNPDYIVPIEEYSGHGILKKIKWENQGTQVIIVTASNKAWNMKTLLDKGANGYYIKESPEYRVNDDFSRESFQNLLYEIRRSLKRQHLKQAFKQTSIITETIRQKLHGEKLPEHIANSMITHVEFSYKLLQLSLGNENVQFAYLALFKVVEQIRDYFIRVDNNGVYHVAGLEPLKKYEWVDENQKYRVNPNGFEGKQPNTFEKLAGISFQLLGLTDEHVEKIYYAVLRRNHIVHPQNLNGKTQHQIHEIEKCLDTDGYLELAEMVERMLL